MVTVCNRAMRTGYCGTLSVLTLSPLPLCPGAARPPLQPQTGTETGRERARARGGAFLEAMPTARPRDGGGASSLREPGDRQTAAECDLGCLMWVGSVLWWAWFTISALLFLLTV